MKISSIKMIYFEGVLFEKYIKNDSDYYDNIEIEGNDGLWVFIVL